VDTVVFEEPFASLVSRNSPPGLVSMRHPFGIANTGRITVLQ
jgi:hypothetical protein